MTEQPTNTGGEQAANKPAPNTRATTGDKLRFVPPAAALGTAFVLQVILITDTVGTALANRQPGPAWNWPWYLFAALLGLAVACCAEGGAAYLMDLYDKHLLAGDSVWVLRLAMVGYVAGSGAAIHWWTTARDLPQVVGWLLAGMSASALFLWSRGSRWARRDAMRAAGQLDPALPRLSAAAKFWHPIRWINTLRLVSWTPVATTAEARAVYEQWAASRKPATTPAVEPVRTFVEQPEQVGEQASTAPAASAPRLVSISTPTSRRPRKAVTPATTGPAPTIDQLADALTEHPVYGARTIGRPTAEQILRGVFGSCDSTRAKQAKDIHNARIAAKTEQPDDDAEDRDRVLVAVGG